VDLAVDEDEEIVDEVTVAEAAEVAEDEVTRMARKNGFLSPSSAVLLRMVKSDLLRRSSSSLFPSRNTRLLISFLVKLSRTK